MSVFSSEFKDYITKYFQSQRDIKVNKKYNNKEFQRKMAALQIPEYLESESNLTDGYNNSMLNNNTSKVNDYERFKILEVSKIVKKSKKTKNKLLDLDDEGDNDDYYNSRQMINIRSEPNLFSNNKNSSKGVGVGVKTIKLRNVKLILPKITKSSKTVLGSYDSKDGQEIEDNIVRSNIKDNISNEINKCSNLNIIDILDNLNNSKSQKIKSILNHSTKNINLAIPSSSKQLKFNKKIDIMITNKQLPIVHFNKKSIVNINEDLDTDAINEVNLEYKDDNIVKFKYINQANRVNILSASPSASSLFANKNLVVFQRANKLKDILKNMNDYKKDLITSQSESINYIVDNDRSTNYLKNKYNMVKKNYFS